MQHVAAAKLFTCYFIDRNLSRLKNRNVRFLIYTEMQEKCKHDSSCLIIHDNNPANERLPRETLACENNAYLHDELINTIAGKTGPEDLKLLTLH